MAKTAKVKKYKVAFNPELRQVLKGFVPAFGSDEDLSIVNRVMKLENDLELVDNDILRGNPKEHTSKMKTLLREEKYLISAVIRRNLDF